MTSQQVYNLAQGFYVDPSAVKNASRVDVTAIDLYFNQKPPATGNKSGIDYPGAVMYLVNVDANKRPVLDQLVAGTSSLPFARVEYTDIVTSGTASQATTFRFSQPISVDTGKEYCMVLQYDGNENFILWKNKANDLLLGSNTISSGAAGSFVGDYYDAFYVDPTAQSAIPTWAALSSTDLKFSVKIARYFIDNVLVTSNNVPATTAIYGQDTSTFANLSVSESGSNFSISTNHYEYVVFDGKHSSFDNISGGEKVYQNAPFYPGGSANGVSISVTQGSNKITANTLYPNGSNFSWNDVFQSSPNEQIVIVSQNQDGANTQRTNIRRVVSIQSNTALIVDNFCDFSNSAAYFFKSPIAKVNILDNLKLSGVDAGGMVNSKLQQNCMLLYESNANSTVRFVNNSISLINITASGNGYSNTDYIKFYGYEDNAFVVGGYPAVANISTNSNGSIQNIYLSNTGAGFVNTSNVFVVLSRANVSFSSVSSVSTNTSAGSGLTYTISADTTLTSEHYGLPDGSGGYFSNTHLINVPINQIIAYVNFNNVSGVDYTMDYENPYYLKVEANTFIGASYHYDTTRQVNNLVNDVFSDINEIYQAVIPSKSNEFIILNDATGLVSNTPPAGSGTLDFVGISNNDFIPIQPNEIKFGFSHYAINNDYTNENTNYGSADAKYITKKVSFDNNKFAEDIVAYLTAYRPEGADIKLFARIQNSNDSEAFDDKDWTLLNITDGNIFSSSTDPTNYIQMTFGFPPYPNTAFNLAGSVTVADTANVIVTGQGTSFLSNATANLMVNDLVKIYSPLFPLTDYWVSVVTSVANDSYFTISDPIANNGTIGAGLKVDLIGRVGNTSVAKVGYPQQAFSNSPNENVVRYFTSSMNPVDTYDTMQMKIVLLSNSTIVQSNQSIPRVDSIQIVGVSA